MRPGLDGGSRQSGSLVDVLDRILDKGLVVAGDIRVSLADVELLTIRIRLLVCSIDKAEAIGLDWWKSDPDLSSGLRNVNKENRELRERVQQLERRLAALPSTPPPATLGAAPRPVSQERKKRRRNPE